MGVRFHAAYSAGLRAISRVALPLANPLKKQQQRCLQSSTLRIRGPALNRQDASPSAATEGEEAAATGRNSATQAPGRAEWPADITERARRVIAAEESSHTAPSEGQTLQRHHGVSGLISQVEMQRQLQAETAQAFWSRVKRTVARPLSGAAAELDASFGHLEGAPKGTAASPIVYKRYVDGMTAAHHYPARLLPINESTQVPPRFFVTPFDLEENPDPLAHGGRAAGLMGAGLFKSRTGMQPRTALAERLYGRVSLLFLFDLGGQYSQLSDVAAWLDHLKRHPAFLSAIYGPPFAAAASTSGISPSQEQKRTHQQRAFIGVTPATAAPDLASVSYLCVDHAPAWLRPLAIRSMRRLAPAFHPLSPFHNFPQRLLSASRALEGPPVPPKDPEVDSMRQVAEEYDSLCSLAGRQALAGGLVGSFLGYSGSWGALETEALKRKERHKFVTVLLVDKAARIRWHATGMPTEEAVLLLL
ncbi:uncharacterized protein LOC34621449 [Cyclospora cayetanensis]|nr:uncharacterized protein LOC34621449 [Cyclospora cayetanensis]